MSDHSTSTPDPLNENLKRAFPFTDEDLAANRANQMTAPQRETLSHKQSSTKNSLFGFMAFVAIFGFCFITSLTSGTTSSRPRKANPTDSVIGFVVLVGGISLFLLFKSMSLGDDISNNRVMSIRGTVTRRHYRTRNREHWWIMAGEKTFDVPKHIHDAFVDHEPYILYYTAISETLVAAEHVPPSLKRV
jgi:hypothetical protein